MRGIRRGDMRWVAFGALLVMVATATGIAASVNGDSSPRIADRHGYAAAGHGEAMVLPNQTIPGLTTSPTVAPATSTTVSKTAPTTAPASRPAPTTAPTTTSVPDPAVPPPPVDYAAAMPPITAPPNPGSWSLDQDGVSIRLRMTPSAPHVGDTVEFTFETWASGSTNDTCCITTLSVNHVMLYNLMHEQGPGCPAPATPREHRVSYKITGPEVMIFQAPLILSINLQATKVGLCEGLPQFSGATLATTAAALP